MGFTSPTTINIPPSTAQPQLTYASAVTNAPDFIPAPVIDHSTQLFAAISALTTQVTNLSQQFSTFAGLQQQLMDTNAAVETLNNKVEHLSFIIQQYSTNTDESMPNFEKEGSTTKAPQEDSYLPIHSTINKRTIESISTKPTKHVTEPTTATKSNPAPIKSSLLAALKTTILTSLPARLATVPN